MNAPVGPAPAVYDDRVDAAGEGAHESLVTHARQQALMRCYQARYVLLPTEPTTGSIVERLGHYYGEDRLQGLYAARRGLEAELIEPFVAGCVRDEPSAAYVERILGEIAQIDGNPLTALLATLPSREHHYRNFLVQSAPDLLAEASASALGVVGEYGAPQSALFRILIDEFGYGSHRQKHSILYRAAMRSFGLRDEYNAYWPLFDTEALFLHNLIGWLFQNPRNFFKQVGFLLYAEASYQRSTEAHYRYLSEFHPAADARYFGEHAHIDIHHTRMVVDEVIAPLVARFGEEVGAEIVTGSEATRLAFARVGAHAVAVSRAFEAAPDRIYGLGAMDGVLVTPAAPGAGRVQVGAIGSVSAQAFAAFPAGATGRAL